MFFWKIQRDSTVLNSSGPITVRELVRQPNDVAWLAGPHRILDRSASRSLIAGIQGVGNAPEIVIDTGRTRLFRQLSNLDQLAAVVLEPALGMDYCRDEQIHGICLFTRSAEREISMRVFTTSLARANASTRPATAMHVLETKIKKMDLQQFDRHALDAGRNFIDNQVRVGAVSQPDGFAHQSSAGNLPRATVVGSCRPSRGRPRLAFWASPNPPHKLLIDITAHLAPV